MPHDSDLRCLGPHLHTLCAHNPSPMTGAGTQSYFIGQHELLLVDPGPDLPDQCARLLQAIAALDGRLCGIVLTHLHRDHAPAARALHASTGAPIYAMPATPADSLQLQDLPLQALHDGQLLATDGGDLRTVHTPGHVDNHCCFWWESGGDLLTGDHLITGSTVVIIPPYGHMGRYMDSLERLSHWPIRRLLPGHGAPMRDAQAVIAATLAHRRARAAKVLAQLRPESEALASLLTRVYDDAPTHLHALAALSLQAHLLQLQEEGLAEESASGWRLTASSR